MNELRPSEIIQWFRGKAAEFQRIADALETTFNADGQPSLQGTKEASASFPTLLQNGASKVTVETVKKMLSGIETGVRYTTIAQQLGADSEEVRTVLWGNPGTFEQSGRGWWKVKE